MNNAGAEFPMETCDDACRKEHYCMTTSADLYEFKKCLGEENSLWMQINTPWW